MCDPTTVEPAVSKMFGRYRRVWEDALMRWISKCKGVKEELKTLEATGGLVADASRFAPRRQVNPAVSDAIPAGPSGLTPEVVERMGVLERRSTTCASTIRHIQLVIRDLEDAQKHGIWNNRQKLWVGLREHPKFTGKSLGRVSRDETIEVLDLKGEWWRVRSGSGVEGWMHRGEIAPVLPVELTGKLGDAPILDDVPDSSGGRG